MGGGDLKVVEAIDSNSPDSALPPLPAELEYAGGVPILAAQLPGMTPAGSVLQ